MTPSDFMCVTIIAAEPEQVWRALTTAEFTRQYWHSTRVRSDWQEGGVVEFMVDDGDGGERVGCEGTLLEVDMPRRLSYTWRFPGNPEVADEAPSRVSFELEPLPGCTRLTVIHDNFPENSKMQPLVSGGWPFVLSGLKTLLETGRATDFSQLH